MSDYGRCSVCNLLLVVCPACGFISLCGIHGCPRVVTGFCTPTDTSNG